jgi:hypothetical protein
LALLFLYCQSGGRHHIYSARKYQNPELKHTKIQAAQTNTLNITLHGAVFSHVIYFLKNPSKLTTHNLEFNSKAGLIREKMKSFESTAYHQISPNS